MMVYYEGKYIRYFICHWSGGYFFTDFKNPQLIMFEL